MTLTFAIADLHGRHDLLDLAFARILDYAPIGGGHTIVTMGDYIDRGPDSHDVIETLMAGSPDRDFDLICLKGNHEDIMLQACANPGLTSWWVGNGGGMTLLSHGHPEGEMADVKFADQRHLDWAKSLPLHHIDKHRIFVHAGVKPGIPLNEQIEEDLIWMLYPEGADDDFLGRHIVHGHHQFEDGPKCYAGRTDLDTLAWLTGRLVVGVFDDDEPGGPIDLLEVIGPHYNELMARN